MAFRAVTIWLDAPDDPDSEGSTAVLTENSTVQIIAATASGDTLGIYIPHGLFPQIRAAMDRIESEN